MRCETLCTKNYYTDYTQAFGVIYQYVRQIRDATTCFGDWNEWIIHGHMQKYVF